MGRHATITAPATSADIAEIRAELAALRELLERALATTPARTWLTVDETAALSDFSPQAIRGWARSHRIGTCVKGSWRIDRAHLRAHIVARFGQGRLPPAFRDA